MTKKHQKASRQAKANKKQQRIARDEPESSTNPSLHQGISATSQSLEVSEDVALYLFFFKEDVEPWGFLSNWYQPAIFQDPVSGHTFSNSEQYMMYHKALLGKSEILVNTILKTTDPRKVKGLGREATELPYFDADEWTRLRQGVMREGCYLKFGQNLELREKLLSTGNKVLVEASRFDRIWGIGFDESHALDRKKDWGESLLGKCLMRVRDRLQTETDGGIFDEKEWRTD